MRQILHRKDSKHVTMYTFQVTTDSIFPWADFTQRTDFGPSLSARIPHFLLRGKPIFAGARKLTDADTDAEEEEGLERKKKRALPAVDDEEWKWKHLLDSIVTNLREEK